MAAEEGGVPSPVPQTGQSQCWDESGTAISCTGTGQDGEYQTGVTVDPRFTDNGDGTVTDNLTGLIWLRNADCFWIRNWTDALSDVNGLADGSCGLSDGSAAGDWRVPNVRELQSLVDFDEWLPPLPEGRPFFAEQSAHYWSSTTRLIDPTNGWYVHFGVGYVGGLNKYNAYLHVWPVRDGQSGRSANLAAGTPPSPLPKTGQQDSYYPGDDGAYKMGVTVAQRFTNNGDGTVTDNLTGLIWLQDAACIWANWTDGLAVANSLADGSCGLTDSSVAGDWRMPNVRELYSLVDYGEWAPALPEGHPFPLVLWDSWTSTTRVDDPSRAWMARHYSGVVITNSKSTILAVWPVRDGQSGILVDINIHPDSYVNAVNPHSRGVIPVAILGGEHLDVADIDETTLSFGPGGAPIAHRHAHFEDVNLDGTMDLVTHYRTQDTGIVCGDESARLFGDTIGGQPFEGMDSIQTVRCRVTRRPAIWIRDEENDIAPRGGVVDIERK
jgi:hypothetical protein